MAKHAFLSASASHRWINCPPSAKLCEGIKDESSPYAQKGTDCHELCAYLVEKALGRDVTDPTESLSYYSGEMQNCAEEYRDYVLEQYERSKKSDTVTVNKIKAAIQAAYEEGESKLKGTAKVCPALDVIKTPLRDGDKERPGDEAYKDSYFINSNSATAPGIVDADRQQIIDRSEVYSGVYCRASINLYAFNSNGNRGIACGLNNLQKIRDGEPLGGKPRVEDDFATEEADDFLN